MELKVQIQLVHEGPKGVHGFPWAPAGHGRHDHNTVLLLVEEQAPKFDFEVKIEGSHVHIHAPAADQIELSYDRPQEPTGSRSPDPWSVNGRDQISCKAYMPGWHHLEARWKMKTACSSISNEKCSGWKARHLPHLSHTISTQNPNGWKLNEAVIFRSKKACKSVPPQNGTQPQNYFKKNYFASPETILI